MLPLKCCAEIEDDNDVGSGALKMRKSFQLKDYMRSIENICDDWLRHSGATGRGLSPQTSRNGEFLRAVYALVLSYRDCGKLEIIKKLVEKDGNAPARGPTFEENPFHWALLSVFSEQGDGPDRRERSLFAYQMLYADRHKVPPHLLIGFIYQCGKQTPISQRLKQGEIEPGFSGVIERG